MCSLRWVDFEQHACVQGSLECTWCHATETACWRRHHRTRALLCNACGVRANNPNNSRFGARVMGVRKKPASKKYAQRGPRKSPDERKAAQALREPRTQAKKAGTGPPQPASAHSSVKAQSLAAGSGPSELAPAQQSLTQEPLHEPARKWLIGRRSALRTAPTSAFRPVQPGAAQQAPTKELLHASSMPSSRLPAKRPLDAGFPEATPKKVQQSSTSRLQDCQSCGPCPLPCLCDLSVSAFYELLC